MSCHDIRVEKAVRSFSLPTVPSAGVGVGVCTLEAVSEEGLVSGAPGSSVALRTGEGPWMIAGCDGGSVSVFAATSGRVLVAAKLHEGDVRSVAFLPPARHASRTMRSGSNSSSSSESALIVTSSFDGTAAIWRLVADGSSAVRFERVALLKGDVTGAAGHSDKVLGVTVLQSTRQVVTCGADGQVLLWG